MPVADGLNLGNQESSIPKLLLRSCKMILIGSAVVNDYESHQHTCDNSVKERKLTNDMGKTITAFQSVGNPFKEESGIALINVETGENASTDIIDMECGEHGLTEVR